MRIEAGDKWGRLLTPVAAVSALLVAVPYAVTAIALVGYRWDWAPDEGLFLDYARRFTQSPSSLYPRTVVPTPDFYGPVFPMLLAPVVASFGEPLGAARVLAGLWTVAIVGCAYALVRRRAPVHLAVVMAALVLAPYHLSFWYLLVRPDGPLLAFWIGAAVAILPVRLERGAGALSWPRAWAGAALLVAAVFSKPTAVLHGAPLVLGWLLVDLRSAVRLGASTATLAGAVIAVLEASTPGGYLQNLGHWRSHGDQPGLLAMNLRYFLQVTAPILAVALIGLLVRLRRGDRVSRDPSLLLMLGGLATAPALGKWGALPNYLLPFLLGVVVFAGRSWSPEPTEAPGGLGRRAVVGTLAAVAAALILIRTQELPLPPRGAEATARAFYDGLASVVERDGRPLLALRPEYAYYHVGQPVEVDGAFKFLLAAGAPGARRVLADLESRRYRTVVLLPMSLTDDEPLARALHREYRTLGVCELSYYYGPTRALIMVPRDRVARFDPPAATQCRRIAPGS